MELDQRCVFPFPPDQTRHDVIHRAEHDHGEKSVKPEMRIGDARLGKMKVPRARAERNQDAQQTKTGVGDRAENSEAQRRAITHERKISAHGHVMIQAHGRDRNDGKNAGRDAGGDHPGREWSIDQTLHSGPTGKKRVSPKTDRGQMVAVNRTPDHFRDHVISRAQTDRAEPEEHEVIREPPVHRRLHHALHRHDEKHDLSRAVEPGEPKKRGQQIPLRDVDVAAAAEAEHQDRPGND